MKGDFWVDKSMIYWITIPDIKSLAESETVRKNESIKLK